METKNNITRMNIANTRFLKISKTIYLTNLEIYMTTASGTSK
jgi:hypothetical protein